MAQRRKEKKQHTYQSLQLQPSTTVDSKETKKSYVDIFEGFIGRYIKGVTPHDGLSTGDIAKSNVYVVLGERDEKTCYSLIHANAATTKKQIEDEIAWAGGKKAKIILIKHPLEPQETPRAVEINLESLQQKSEIKILPKKFNAMCIHILPTGNLDLLGRNTEINHNHALPFKLTNHPKALHIHSAHQFNMGIGAIYETLKMAVVSVAVNESKSSSQTFLTPNLFKYSPQNALLFDGQQFREFQHQPVNHAEVVYQSLIRQFPNPQNLNLQNIGIAIHTIFKKDIKELIKRTWPQTDAENLTATTETMFNKLTKNEGLQTSLSLAAFWFCYMQNPTTKAAESDVLNAHFLPFVNTARRYSGREPLVNAPTPSIPEYKGIQNSMNALFWPSAASSTRGAAESKEAKQPTRTNIPEIDIDAIKVFFKAALGCFILLKYASGDSLPNPVAGGIAVVAAIGILKLAVDRREKNIQYYTQNQHRDRDLDPGNGPSAPGMNG